MKIKKLLTIFVIFVFLICSHKEILFAMTDSSENHSLALTSKLKGDILNSIKELSRLHNVKKIKILDDITLEYELEGGMLGLQKFEKKDNKYILLETVFYKEYTDMMHTKTFRFVFDLVNKKWVFRYVIIRINETQKEIKIGIENIEFDKSVIRREGDSFEDHIKALGEELRCGYDGTKVVISAKLRGGMRRRRQPEAGPADEFISDADFDILLSRIRDDYENTLERIIGLLHRMSISQLKRLWMKGMLIGKLEERLIQKMIDDDELNNRIYQVILSEERNWAGLDFWIRLAAIELLSGVGRPLGQVGVSNTERLLVSLREQEGDERIRERINWVILIMKNRWHVDVGEIENYICPISRDVLKDPVIASDKHIYDRANLVEWFARLASQNNMYGRHRVVEFVMDGNVQSMFTRERMTLRLKRDIILKSFIDIYVKKNGEKNWEFLCF